MIDDYLALPGDPPAEKTAEPEKAFAVVPADEFAGDIDEPPKVSETALLAASEAEKQFDLAYHLLSQKQRRFIKDLRNMNFNRKQAVKIYNRGFPTSKTSVEGVATWMRNPNFKLVVETLRRDKVEDVTHRDELLLRAHRAAQYAETPQPVLYQGADSGFRERNLGDMIRANEQLMKATKVLGADVVLGGGGTGPALVIQVVQRDGALIDVTPQRVPVELPAPDGP